MKEDVIMYSVVALLLGAVAVGILIQHNRLENLRVWCEAQGGVYTGHCIRREAVIPLP